MGAENGEASILADAATALVPQSPPFLQKLLPRLEILSFTHVNPNFHGIH